LPPEPVFFTDRDLGKVVPRILREHGLQVEQHSDHIADHRTSDHEWLKLIAGKGWIALSHDDNIRRDKVAVQTVMENKGRLFILRGSCIHPELAQMFLSALKPVRGILLRNREAFIGIVRRSVRSGGIVKAEAQLWLRRRHEITVSFARLSLGKIV
jgi:hypothetical protein